MTSRTLMLSSLLCLLASGQAMHAAPASQAAPVEARKVRFNGSASVSLSAPAEGGELTRASEAVDLKVGHLYRLSARVKTKGVKVDPEARYPTALGACLSMKSFPFTNSSPALAADRSDRVEVLFFAATAKDQVQVHLGRNGKAWGSATFEDVTLEKVEDIRAYIPMENVRWAGKAFRYDDGGWTFVHVEGEPHARGRQYGELMAADIARFLEKLAVSHDAKDPVGGWQQQRTMADALFLRKYDVEFLEEMKGIAEGAAAAGASFRGRPLDLLDVVTLNSAIDLDYVSAGLRVATNPLTGRTFPKAEDQSAGAPDRDKCSAFVATGSATVDGHPIITQMFMWGGYMGVEWNVMVDVAPTRGQRLVFQTFPGGISSGADWYVNGAGLVIGETTVGQTPFDAEGSTQSNRIRRAAQYATGIDSFVELFRKGNNGLYTNEWLLADTRTGEGADYLLGTQKEKLWRTGSAGKPADTPGQLKDFIWANNNNRSLEVRTEYAQNPEEAPVDLAFNTWNRDIAFWQFYEKYGKGRIDLDAAVRAMASSPISRPHGCDGKVTTAEMASQLMFMAHFGKPTQREKLVGGRYIAADLPNATPHLTLGFTTFSPIFVTERLQALRTTGTPKEAPAAPKADLGALKDSLKVDKAKLWKRTVIPATEQDFWYSSASAAYHGMLKRLPEAPDKAFDGLRDQLADLTGRYLYFADREGAEAPAKTPVRYDRYGAYQLPRAKGIFLLHQLRLHLGFETFAKVMNAVQDRYAGKAMGTADFIATASEAAGKDLAPLIRAWTDRADLPDPKVQARAVGKGEGFELTVTVTQAGTPWHLMGSLEVVTAKGARMERIEVQGPTTTFTFASKEKPLTVRFNAGQDFPSQQKAFASLANVSDHFEKLLFVWGSARTPEAGRTLALGLREAVAESVSEYLMPMKADAEVTDRDLADRDLVLLGGAADNSLVARLAREHKLPVELGRGFFRWQGRTYGRSDDGLLLCLPNPWNPKRNLYLFAANSRLQLWHMTRGLQRGIPAWALYRGAEITTRGSHANPAFEVKVD